MSSHSHTPGSIRHFIDPLSLPSNETDPLIREDGADPAVGDMTHVAMR